MSKIYKPLKCAFSGISDPDVLRCLGYEKPNNGEYKTMMATRKKYLQSLTSGSLSNAPIRKRPSNESLSNAPIRKRPSKSQKSNVGRNSRYVPTTYKLYLYVYVMRDYTQYAE